MASKFRRDLDKAYKEKVLGTLETAVRTIAFVVDAELVKNTPVDLGRARANWLPSLNVPDVTIIPPPIKGESIARKADIATAISAYVLADTILITNNLPYIKALNDGSSTQAPAGFVDEALAKGKRALS